MYRPIVTGLLLATACFLPRTLFATAEEAAESHVVQLDADRFDAELPTKHHFVMFYAPWCGHCTVSQLIKKSYILFKIISPIA